MTFPTSKWATRKSKLHVLPWEKKLNKTRRSSFARFCECARPHSARYSMEGFQIKSWERGSLRMYAEQWTTYCDLSSKFIVWTKQRRRTEGEIRMPTSLFWLSRTSLWRQQGIIKMILCVYLHLEMLTLATEMLTNRFWPACQHVIWPSLLLSVSPAAITWSRYMKRFIRYCVCVVCVRTRWNFIWLWRHKDCSLEPQMPKIPTAEQRESLRAVDLFTDTQWLSVFPPQESC